MAATKTSAGSSSREYVRINANHERLKVIAHNLLLAIEKEDERDIEKSAEELRGWFKYIELA